MATDKFLIAPFDSGLVISVKPFMIPDTAFTKLRNAYVWRGRIVKRFGSELSGNGATTNIEQTLFSRCAIDLSSLTAATTLVVGQTDALGSFSGYANNFIGFFVGQKFTIGADTYTVNALGNPNVMTASGGPATLHSLDTTTGQLIFTTAPANADIIFYPFFTLASTGLMNAIGGVTGIVPGSKYYQGQQFSITYVLAGVKYIDVFTVIDGTAGAHSMICTNANITTMTFNTTTGQYIIQYAAGFWPPNLTPIFYYPSEPIMGFSQYETIPVNDQPAYAYDTQFIYRFVGGRWLLAAPIKFHGTDYKSFWITCYKGLQPEDVAMFVTNNYVVNPSGAASPNDDPMWYYNGTNWHAFAPIVVPGIAAIQKRVISARTILPFKRHLVMFDVIEQINGVNKHYPYRVRIAMDGSPVVYNAFYEPTQLGSSGGDYLDASTQEGIRSVEYLKDRLVVYFERSTWELVYTGNDFKAFEWNKLNTELGSEATFSTVPFDQVVLSIGSSGIHACNGSNVQRIDDSIPDYIFQFNNDTEGTARIQGIRDYKTEMVYWSVPLESKTPLSYFPNTILVYNYKNNSWAENDDCITAFGYFEQTLDKTWADMTIPWNECNFPWDAYTSIAKSRLIIAGNQQGYVFILNPALTGNARVMSVTNMVYDPITRVTTLTIMNHTLRSNEYIKLYDLQGITVDPLDEGIHKVVLTTKDTITINDYLVTGGTYTGGGTVGRVSNVKIKSKQWNFYMKDGRNFLVSKMDFYVTRSSGQLITDFSTNSTGISMRTEAINNGMAMGDYKISLGGVNGTEPQQERIWRSAYFQAEGNCIQLSLFMDDDMIKKNANAFSTLEINAIMLHCKPTANVMEEMLNGY